MIQITHLRAYVSTVSIGIVKNQQVTVLPQALKAWRGERHLSQAALAELAGISEGLIAQIETGRRQPGLTNLIAIAAVLRVDPRALALVHVDLGPLVAVS